MSTGETTQGGRTGGRDAQGAPAVDAAAAGMPEVLEERKLRGVRRVIARRLSESWQQAVHVTLHRDVDVTDLWAHRQKGSPSAVDYLLLAVARTLKEQPEFNATFDGEVHRLYRSVNLGYAVDTPRGLVVPVVRNAEELELARLAAERKRLVEKVLAWSHEAQDVEGGTFTVTNLGTMGVDYFTPIINPPQVAILGLGRLRSAPVSWSAAEPPQNRLLIPMSLSFDHRVIDGAAAARFLQGIQDRLGAPASLESPG